MKKKQIKPLFLSFLFLAIIPVVINTAEETENTEEVSTLKKLEIYITDGNKEEIEKLLKKELDVNSILPETGCSLLGFVVRKGKEDLVKCLLKMNANVDHGSPPPLYIAALCGSLSTVQLLLDQNPDINATNDKRETPLLEVVDGLRTKFKPGNHLAIAQLLVDQKNIEIGKKNKDGLSPLGNAIGHMKSATKSKFLTLPPEAMRELGQIANLLENRNAKIDKTEEEKLNGMMLFLKFLDRLNLVSE